MVEYRKLEGLQIWEISGNMETEDLLAIADEMRFLLGGTVCA
jgi:hypothetical protein